MDRHSLFSLSSNYIVYYVTENPIIWLDRGLARRGGIGDQCGMTPTPAVQEFLALLLARRDLFTQAEFARYCLQQWRPWSEGLTYQQERGVVAKLYNNFYPAMIDALHVQAMVVEHGEFDICLIDTAMDVQDKIDLVIVLDHQTYRIALFGPTREARRDRAFKVMHRPGANDDEVIPIQLPADRPKAPGNKRWFQYKDLQPLLERTR